MSRCITVISGGRADWGLLSPVCRALDADPAFSLRIVVTGQHLMAGATSVAAIEAEGFDVAARIDMALDEDDSAQAITAALGRGIIGFGAELSAHRPDLLLILGDRYEILGAVQAALIAKVPVAHLCGGDITEGAIDDSIRHAMTKLSHLHFVTNEEAAQRVIQLGENPDHVHCVGSTGLDHIHTMQKMSREEFYASIAFAPRAQNIMVTFHPVTIEDNSLVQCQAMLDALAKLGDDVGIICTGSNADPQGAEITAMVRSFAGEHQNACYHESLGSARYLNGLCHVEAMVGNSSSGLYEAPSFGPATINIGTRQQGRLKATSVIDCAAEEGVIYNAIQTALQQPRGNGQNPYGDGHSAARILDTLKSTDNYAGLCHKIFYNLEGTS